MVLEAMAILEQQQPVLVDRRRGGMEWDAFRHPGRKGDEQPVLEQLERLHLAAIIRESEKHEVELPAMERTAGRMADCSAEEQLEVRPFQGPRWQRGGGRAWGGGGEGRQE